MDNASATGNGAGGHIHFNPDEQAEFDAWDKLSDEAWAMIDWWEADEKIARDSD